MFANCDPSAPEYLGRIRRIFFPFSFFIKSWEKHLWRILLRPILLILERSHCLSTASFDILSHFPRSGSRAGIWSQFDSPPLKKQLSSLHCVWRELVKCAIFSLYSKCPSVCVKMGKICLMAEVYYQHPLQEELILWYVLLFDGRLDSTTEEFPDSTPYFQKFAIKNRPYEHKCSIIITNVDCELYNSTTL